MSNLEIDKIYLGDCIEGMKGIENGSVDLVLTDLPYGTTSNKWDVCLPLDKLFRELLRVTKENAAMLFFCQQPFETDLINAGRKLFRYEWIWDKQMSTGFLNANKMPLKRHENIAVFYQKLPTYHPQFVTGGNPYIRKSNSSSTNYRGGIDRTPTVSDGRRFPVDIISFAQVNISSDKPEQGEGHPTQKPVDICEYLIKTYSDVGDLVLDCCMGSGTTAVACIGTDRHFIGFEKDETYFERACKRIEKRYAEGVQMEL
ncbi:MAG: site-specific DNA-methyltransferase [Oscillospiraceae bacterium]|nr:site-specific DNA-methyltransferase [Oscillospiraceae bacterium]